MILRMNNAILSTFLRFDLSGRLASLINFAVVLLRPNQTSKISLEKCIPLFVQHIRDFAGVERLADVFLALAAQH